MRLVKHLLVFLIFANLFSMGLSLSITIVHTSNIYGTVFPYNHFSDSYENMGLASIHNYLLSLRRVNPNVLVIDTGNMFYGSPFGDFSAEKGNVPVSEAFRMIRYDAFVPGTFELTSGQKFLENISSKINAPLLSTNISGLSFVKKYVLKQLPNGVKVAIIGATPNVGEFNFKNLLSSVKESIDEVKKQGANIVVLAVSGGLTNDPVTGQRLAMKSILNIGDALVKEFSKDVDVFLFGNLPIAYVNAKSNKVYSLLGNSGKSVNKIEITLEKVNNSIKIKSSKVQNISMSTVSPSDEILTKLEQYEKEFYYWLQEPVFTSSESFLFSKYMTLITDDAITDFLNKTIIEFSKASVGIWNIFNPTFQGIPEGIVTRKHIYNMIGRTTSVKLIKMSGKDVENIILKNLQKLDFVNGKVKISKEIVQSPWLFDLFENLEYFVQVNEDKKILKLTYSGKPVQNNDIFYVSVPSARLVGKEQITFGEIVRDIEIPVQKIIFDSIKRASGLVTLKPDNNRETYVKLIYKVQAGDSLRKISYRIAVQEEELLRLNTFIKDPNIIRPGWELVYYRRYLDLIPPLKEFFELE